MGFHEYHHIDSSVYLRAVDEVQDGFSETKSDYIVKLGRRFGCSISIHIIGEIFNRICKKISERNTRNLELTTFGDFLVKQNIAVVTIIDEDLKLCEKLRELDYKSHEPELLALAIAINRKANVFTTYDQDLLNSAPVFKRFFKIKVKKPLNH